MNIYYQWVPWAYSHKTSLELARWLWISPENIHWLFSFKDVHEKIAQGHLWVLPIENSYAWSIHENIYFISRYSVKIHAEYYLEVKHCLLSSSSDISTVKEVYSHIQALMQCEKYLVGKWLVPAEHSDTAWAAQFIASKNDSSLASISSDLAAEIYGLHILERNIQDQDWNTTRFFLVSRDDIALDTKLIPKSWKKTVVFKTKHIPAALYKCLWAFATRSINISKIESLPARNNPFEYMFWLDFELPSDENFLDQALEELHFFWTDIKVVGRY